MKRAAWVVTRKLTPAADRLLQQCAKECSVALHQWTEDRPVSRSELLDLVRSVSTKHDQSVRGILCLLTEQIDTDVLDAAGPSLNVVSSMSVGVDHVDVRALERRGIKLGNTPGVLTDATAEITVALVLAACRRLPEGIEAVKTGAWSTWSPLWMCGRGLSGSTVGIVGMGLIGRAVADRLTSFGSKIVYTGASGPKPGLPNYGFRPFPDLLAEADIVVATCELNEHTRKLFNAAAFAQMKPQSIFVNTSRGGVVDQDALVAALQSGHLWAAALDVTTPEPLPVDHELLRLRNCIVLPHLGSATLQTREQMARLAVENLVRGSFNEPLLHQYSTAASRL